MYPKLIKEFEITEDDMEKGNDFISLLHKRGELCNEYYMFGVVYLTTTDKNEPHGFVFTPVDNDWHMVEDISDATGFPIIGWFGKGEKDNNLYAVINRLIMSWHENHENNDND